MKRYIYSLSLLIASAAFILLSSCDKVDGPYDRDTTPGISKGRKVLLEEFTGHKCPNCPEASLQAHELQHDYPEVILISIHAGDFAKPNVSGIFNTDFRSATGDELNSFFQVASYPSGMVSRKQLGNSTVVSPSFWASAITNFQTDDPIARLTITNSYDSISRTVNVTVKSDFLDSYANPLRMVVYITEDSIIKPQYNNNPNVGTTPYITDYVHRHVLRGSCNGTWGSDFTTAPVSFGSSKEGNYTAILDSTWDDKHCYIVAFLTDKASREVIQVEEKTIR